MLLFNAFFFLLISGSKAQTIYNYYIDDNLDVWVKVDLIPASGTKTIYVIKEAGYTPDGNAVFEFFDDFNDGVIDTNKWQVVFGSWTEQNGVLTITQTGGTDRPTIEALGITISDAIIEWRMRRTNNGGSDGNWMGIIARKQTSTTTYDGYLIYDQDGTTNVYNANIKVYSDVDGVLGAGANLFTDNVFRNWKAVLYGQNIDVFVYDDAGNQLNSLSVTSTAYVSGKLALMIHLAVIGEYDWIRVRKYAQQEPTITITDMGSYYKVDITNNLAQDLVNYQVKLDGASLNIQSQTESLKVTDTPPATTLSITISSPKNQTYLTNKIYLAFNVTSPSDTSFYVRAELDTTIVYENNNYANGTNINISLQQYINDEKTYLVLVTAQDNQGVATKNISFSTNLYDLNVEKQNYYVERGIIRDYRKGLDFGDQYYKKVCGILNGGIIVFSQYNITKLNASNPNQILYSSSINYAPTTGYRVRSSCVVGGDGYIYLTGVDNNNNRILARVQDTGSGFSVVASAQAGTSYAYGDLIFLNNYIYVIYQEYANDYTAYVYKYTNTISLVSSVLINNYYYDGRIFYDEISNEIVTIWDDGGTTNNYIVILSTVPAVLRSGQFLQDGIYDMTYDENYYYIAGVRYFSVGTSGYIRGYITKMSKTSLTSYWQVETTINSVNYYPYIIFEENDTIMALHYALILTYNKSSLQLIKTYYLQISSDLAYYYSTKIGNKAYFFYISRYFREISADPYIEFSNSQTQVVSSVRCGNFNSQYATIEYYANNSLFASTQIACDNSTQTITQNLNTSLEGDLLINVKLIDNVERRNSQLTTYHDITLPEINLTLDVGNFGIYNTTPSLTYNFSVFDKSKILYCQISEPSYNFTSTYLYPDMNSIKTRTFTVKDGKMIVWVYCEDPLNQSQNSTQEFTARLITIKPVDEETGVYDTNLWLDTVTGNLSLMRFVLKDYQENITHIYEKIEPTLYVYTKFSNTSTLHFEQHYTTHSILNAYELAYSPSILNICISKDLQNTKQTAYSSLPIEEGAFAIIRSDSGCIKSIRTVNIYENAYGFGFYTLPGQYALWYIPAPFQFENKTLLATFSGDTPIVLDLERALLLIVNVQNIPIPQFGMLYIQKVSNQNATLFAYLTPITLKEFYIKITDSQDNLLYEQTLYNSKDIRITYVWPSGIDPNQEITVYYKATYPDGRIDEQTIITTLLGRRILFTWWQTVTLLALPMLLLFFRQLDEKNILVFAMLYVAFSAIILPYSEINMYTQALGILAIISLIILFIIIIRKVV